MVSFTSLDRVQEQPVCTPVQAGQHEEVQRVRDAVPALGQPHEVHSEHRQGIEEGQDREGVAREDSQQERRRYSCDTVLCEL